MSKAIVIFWLVATAAFVAQMHIPGFVDGH